MEATASAEERYRAACGAVIGRLRSRNGWSLRQFGERVGTAHTTLYAIERGEAVPGIDILDRIAEVSGLDLPSLFRLIIDELTEANSERPADDASLAAILSSVEPLSAAQRRELLTFTDFLRYRDNAEPS